MMWRTHSCVPRPHSWAASWVQRCPRPNTVVPETHRAADRERSPIIKKSMPQQQGPSIAITTLCPRCMAMLFLTIALFASQAYWIARVYGLLKRSPAQVRWIVGPVLVLLYCAALGYNG